jgi:transposase InsO family protein
MNIHENARTCPHSRRLIAQRRDQGWSRAAVAEAFGISERMVTHWHQRYRGEGEAGLRDRSSAPACSPRRLPKAQQLYIAWLRRAFGWTVERIARQAQLSRSRVARWLARWGLTERGCRMRRRYEHDHPGDLLHLDIKKLARFSRPGHRVTGERRGEARGVGYAFVHVAVDDHSRTAYAEELDDERGITAAGFLERACAAFAEAGVTIRRVLTDNGACYKSGDFAAQCRALGIGQRRTRPYTPRTNGKAERFIATLTGEWAYGRRYDNSDQRRRALPAWLDHYNRQRPHGALGHQPPASRLPAGTMS